MQDNSEQLPIEEEPQLQEVIEPTPGGEGKEPTEEVEAKAEEAPREVKTYTEEEYKNLQRTYDRKEAELRQREQQYQQQMQMAQQQATEERLKAREQWEREQYGDTQEVKDFHAQRRGLMQGAVALQQAEIQSAESFKKAAAAELSEQYGVGYSNLLNSGASNRIEMEAKARQLQFEAEKTRFEESKRKTQDFSSPPPAGGGGNWRHLSPDDKIDLGFKEDERKSKK